LDSYPPSPHISFLGFFSFSTRLCNKSKFIVQPKGTIIIFGGKFPQLGQKKKLGESNKHILLEFFLPHLEKKMLEVAKFKQ
jgi:hypothetical protein